MSAKTWIACALGNKACRDGFTAQYHRLSRLFDALALAHGDGRHPQIMKKLARTDVLVIDDWGLAKLTAPQRRELLDILDDRHGRRSTVVTSQLPVDLWHKMIGEPTHADAILDRLVHNAYRITLKGESLRKNRRQRENGRQDVRESCASAEPMRPRLRRDWVPATPNAIAGGAGPDSTQGSSPAPLQGLTSSEASSTLRSSQRRTSIET